MSRSLALSLSVRPCLGVSRVLEQPARTPHKYRSLSRDDILSKPFLCWATSSAGSDLMCSVPTHPHPESNRVFVACTSASVTAVTPAWPVAIVSLVAVPCSVSDDQSSVTEGSSGSASDWQAPLSSSEPKNSSSSDSSASANDSSRPTMTRDGIEERLGFRVDLLLVTLPSGSWLVAELALARGACYGFHRRSLITHSDVEDQFCYRSSCFSCKMQIVLTLCLFCATIFFRRVSWKKGPITLRHVLASDGPYIKSCL